VSSRSYYTLVRAARAVSETLAGGRGMGAFHRTMSRIVTRDSMLVTVSLGPDTLFTFPASDSYWGHYLLEGRPYEADVLRLLSGLAEIPWAFIDCGANFGYWSALVSGPEFGHHHATAVEMAPTSYEMLLLNNKLNKERITTLQMAVAGRSGDLVRFSQDPSNHAACSAHDSSESSAQPSVTQGTISIDDLVSKYASDVPLLIKLDIEGMESEAIRGAVGLRNRGNFILIVEDHYDDPSSESLKACRELGLSLTLLTAEGLVALSSPSEMHHYKTEPGKGYNVVAYPNEDSSVLVQALKAMNAGPSAEQSL
jgi:FkbM family methyltransferase